MELGERKQKILAAIVDAYIQTGEPVGSKAVVEMLDHAVSSATIRNDMADLAADGYLEQPHTSAGRIPTPKRFCLYIDSLMRRQPLPEKRRREIEDMLAGAASDPERLIEAASQALAAATGCAAVTTTPDQQGSTIRRIEVMRSGNRSAALLLMTSSGVLRSRLCRFEGEVDASLLDRLAKTLNAEFWISLLRLWVWRRCKACWSHLGNMDSPVLRRSQRSSSWCRIRRRQRCFCRDS